MNEWLKTCQIPAKSVFGAALCILGVLTAPVVTLIVLTGIFIGWGWQYMPEHPVSHYTSKILK